MTTQTAPTYLSTAFQSQYNLILLGGSALFSLASASIWPLALGCAAELCWLGVGSRLPAFRRRVDARRESERRAQLDDEILFGMRSLDAEHTARLLAVGQAVTAISLHVESLTQDPAERAAWSQLDQLRLGFLRHYKLDERLRHRLEEMQQAPPEGEVARLSAAYAAEKDLGMRLTLHQGIKLAQRKAEQQTRMTEARRRLQLKLSMAEQGLAHLRGQLQLGVAPSELLNDAQATISVLSDTASFEAELGEAPHSLAPPSSR